MAPDSRTSQKFNLIYILRVKIQNPEQKVKRIDIFANVFAEFDNTHIHQRRQNT
jgi:hypothetical protein